MVSDKCWWAPQGWREKQFWGESCRSGRAVDTQFPNQSAAGAHGERQMLVGAARVAFARACVRTRPRFARVPQHIRDFVQKVEFSNKKLNSRTKNN